MSYRRLLLIILAIIGTASFIFSFAYFDALKRNSPHVLASAAEQTYELNNHGYLFYVTREQYYLFRIMCLGGWALGFIAALGLQVPEMRPSRSNL